jgi:fibronectin-binding autotransporter adhesin
MPYSRRARGRLFLGCSAIAVYSLPSLAWADCTPDPTIASQITICSATDSNGLTVPTLLTQVQVQPGALVQPGANPASIVVSNSATLSVDGLIDGGSGDGLLITNGAPYQTYVPYDPYAGAAPNYNAPSGYLTLYPGTYAYLNVGNTGVVTGATAIRVKQRSDNPTGFSHLSVQNFGAITSTLGPAIIAESGASTDVTNYIGGTIGGISVSLGSVSNGGLIDGGNLSAIDSGAFSIISNTGIIRSSSNSATILLGNNGSIGNNGAIENTGMGPTITATGPLWVYNYTNGSISAQGGTAITTSGSLILSNQGSISGAIDAHLATINATIDTTGGMINGDIRLGSGDDLLAGGLLDITSGTFTNITGVVDGGAGLDTVKVSLASSGTLDAVALPTNFEKMQLALVNEAAITLGSGLDLSNGISVGGSGSIINDRDIASTGSAISTYFSYPAVLSISNSGNIQATLASGTDFALNLGMITSGDNSGTITATGGGGLSASILTYGTTAFTNSGTITADGPGVIISGKFDNQGTVRSTGDVGVINSLGGGTARGVTSTNSGTIEGVGAGLRVDTINFANTGTITATDGLGVDLGSYAGFDNQSGGVVNGTTAAVGTSNSAFNAVIQNAGILNGDVNLIPPGAYDFSSDIFIDNGGTVNGNLLLGGGDDILVTDLGRNAPFAGVTGTVDAGTGNDIVRYRVITDASSTLSIPTSFEGLGYEIANNATLMLTGSGQHDLSLAFSGQGSVDITADLSQTDHIVLNMGAPTLSQLTGLGTYLPSDLYVVSHGTLSLTTTSNFFYYGNAAVNAGSGKFENAGTIIVSGASGGYYLPSAINNASEAINSGTIMLDGAIASSNIGKFTNAGSIVQSTGGAASQGLNAYQIDNSGTISVDGVAATSGYYFGQGTISNSGLIESRQDVGILASGGTINNVQGGTITGKTIAIQGSGTVINAGTINGDVQLGTTYFYGGQGKYVADGGILNGNLTLGSGNDIVLALIGATGISGNVDAGAGNDIFGRFYRADSTAQIGGALPATFETELVEAIGPNTTVTLTGPGAAATSDLWIAGDGRIVNKADLSGHMFAMADSALAADGVGVVTSFTNDGDLSGGFEGGAHSFTNNGAIGPFTPTSMAVDLSSSGDLDFSNHGTIAAPFAVRMFLADADRFSFANSGVIAGHVSISEGYNYTGEGFQSGTIINSGSISTDSEPALGMVVNTHAAPSTLAVVNSGTIETNQAGGSALRLDMNFGVGQLPSTSIDNSGTIRTNSDGFGPYPYPMFLSYVALPSAAILLTGNDTGTPVTIMNHAGGSIEANHYNAAAILASMPIVIENAGTISGSAGTDWTQTLYSNTGYRVDLAYHLAGAIQTGNLEDIVRNTGTITGSIDLGAGNDSLENRSILVGDFFLNDGDDHFVEGLNASFTGTADGGNGSDTLIFDVTGGGTLDPHLYSQFTNFENFGLTGHGSLVIQGTQPIQTLILEGATFDLQQGSTLQTLGAIAITGTGGNDHVINHGAIVGDVVLGGGNDRFDLHPGSTVGGSVDGGAGVNRLGLYLGNSGTPAPLDFTPYSNFEQFTFGSGFGSLSGNTTFALIDVDGGRLVGLAGSTINAPQGITVAPGATFGSAGAINGDIAVRGTLSPGASPGTMTVSGNMILASGSTTLFEMTPTISDALIINGSLTVQAGAALDITGTRPLTPGVTYDLITASNGITGNFSTITKAPTVLGFVRQTGNAVQLLGTLQLLNGANPQVVATNSYINSLLLNNTATQGIYAALPSLVESNGFANAPALATLTPEAYASASQIGIDNGLAISSAVRSASKAPGGKGQGFFGIGQGFGSWHRLNGNRTDGISDARINNGGFLGGIGFASDSFTATAFGGRIYADQALSPLAAKTNADGTFVGSSVDFLHEGWRIGASIVWDSSKAVTKRTLYDGGNSSGHYKLHSLTLDGHVGYRFDMGQGGWRLAPQIGVTHIAVKRGGLTETGGSPFALEVAQRRTKATFLDADLELAINGDASVRPWLSAGWQHRLDGNAVLATAGFTGASGQFTANGAERTRDFAHIGAGVEWSVSKKLDLYARGGAAPSGRELAFAVLL